MHKYPRAFFLLCSVVCLLGGCALARATAERELPGDPQPTPLPANVAPADDTFVYLPLVARSSSSPIVAGCAVFSADNIWNTPVDTLPVDANSVAYVATIGASAPVHADFGSGLWDGGPIGIPYVDVPGTQPLVPVTFDYDDESDPGPYPIPPDAPIEGGADSDGDRHVLIVDRDDCVLYEYITPSLSMAAAPGRPVPARSSIFPVTRSARKRGPPPMLRGCPFCRGWYATRRLLPEKFTTRCVSLCLRHAVPTSGLRATMPPTSPGPSIRRWDNASG